MNQIKSDSLSAIGENIDKRPANDQNDRFVRRLNKYRIHQSDCQTKNDQSFREFCDHENDLTKKLQELATIEVRQKKKAYRRQSSKKSKCEATSSQQVPADAANDFADLNYAEMLSLLEGPSRQSFPFAPPQNPNLWYYLPDSFPNVYEHPLASFNQSL